MGGVRFHIDVPSTRIGVSSRIRIGTVGFVDTGGHTFSATGGGVTHRLADAREVVGDGQDGAVSQTRRTVGICHDGITDSADDFLDALDDTIGIVGGVELLAGCVLDIDGTAEAVISKCVGGAVNSAVIFDNLVGLTPASVGVGAVAGVSLDIRKCRGRLLDLPDIDGPALGVVVELGRIGVAGGLEAILPIVGGGARRDADGDWDAGVFVERRPSLVVHFIRLALLALGGLVVVIIGVRVPPVSRAGIWILLNGFLLVVLLRSPIRISEGRGSVLDHRATGDLVIFGANFVERAAHEVVGGGAGGIAG